MTTQIYLHRPDKVEIAQTSSGPGFIIRIASPSKAYLGLFVDKEFLLDLDSSIRTALLDLEGPTA